MSEPVIIDTPFAVEAKGNDEVYLLDLLLVLAQHKWLVIGMPVLFGVLAMVAGMMMTPMFVSETKLMPPQQQSSGVAAMLGELGGLASAAGGLAGIKSPAELYVGLLESRTISYNLITRFKLRERYNASMDVARDALARNTQISVGRKDGMITIVVNDKDPQFAADLANGYVDELIKLTRTIALTEASQRRLFFETQLLEAKDQLANAEVVLRKTQEKTGLIQPDGQVQALITNAAQLRGTIAAKEVQLSSLRTYAAAQNPELLRAQEELRSLRGQLAKLENGQPSKDGSFMVPTGNLPEVGVEYVRSMRNVKYYETIFELLSKQFELAKIDEAKNAASVQVLDKALPAETKFKPKRTLIALAGVVFGAVFGVVLAFCLAAYRRSRENAAAKLRWQRLARALARR